jgi:hypothetical protein
MILDGFLQFTGASTGIGNSDSATDSPTTGTQDSSNILDLGLSGIPTSASGGGARDIGIGDDPAMKILVVVTTAFGAGTSMSVAIVGMIDNGSAAAGTATTMITGPVVTEANLIVGARLLEIDMPRPIGTAALPRFLKLSFVTVGTHTSGKVRGALVLDRHDQVLQANAVLGGYVAGVTIAN